VKKISTPARAQRVDLRHRRAVHAFHHHDAWRAPLPNHFGDTQQRRTLEIAAQLARIRRLAHEIEFLVEVTRELGDHLARLEAAAVGP